MVSGVYETRTMKIDSYTTNDVLSTLSGLLGDVSRRTLVSWRDTLSEVAEFKSAFDAQKIREGEGRVVIRHYKLIHVKLLFIFGSRVKLFRSSPIALTQTVAFVNRRPDLLSDEYTIYELKEALNQ